MPNPVETFKRPEDIVGRGSKLLKSYKKSLPPRQLVHRIMVRPGINSLQDLLRLYQSKIDGIVVAAVLSKVRWAYRRTPPQERPAVAATARQLLAWLEPFMRFQARYSSVQTLAAVLWGWASLPPSIRRALPHETAARLFSRAAAPSKAEPRSRSKLWLAAPKSMALLAWAAGRVIPPDAAQNDASVQEAAKALAEAAVFRASHFSPLGLSLAADGLARLSPDAGRHALERGLAPDAARRIGTVTERQFGALELVRLLAACGALGVQHIPLFEKAIGAALPQVAGWPAPLVTRLAQALAAAGVRHEPLMAAIVESVHSRRRSFAQPMVSSIAAAAERLQCDASTLRQLQPPAARGPTHAGAQPGAAGDLAAPGAATAVT